MLKDQEITLRACKKEDAKLFYSWRNNFDYIRNTKSIRLPKHEELEEEWLRQISLETNNKSVVLMIEIDQTCVGLVQLNQIDWISKNAFFGIAICEENYKGKGYSTRAAKLMIDYAFSHLNLHKLLAEITANNVISIALFQKLGFILEGTLKEQYYWNNEYIDTHIYALIK